MIQLTFVVAVHVPVPARRRRFSWLGEQSKRVTVILDRYQLALLLQLQVLSRVVSLVTPRGRRHGGGRFPVSSSSFLFFKGKERKDLQEPFLSSSSSSFSFVDPFEVSVS